ncbi:hypothetical protein [Neobacillus endophyticus]|uniref:hypothetical protein n=1 Tax=Neobacillus endophyticus TaxID=2738405 RepID=UPI001C277526|nr:hypothetical protein [Neobacillus endophyticus]
MRKYRQSQEAIKKVLIELMSEENLMILPYKIFLTGANVSRGTIYQIIVTSYAGIVWNGGLQMKCLIRLKAWQNR